MAKGLSWVAKPVVSTYLLCLRNTTPEEARGQESYTKYYSVNEVAIDPTWYAHSCVRVRYI
jgi:hypothetical protein